MRLASLVFGFARSQSLCCYGTRKMHLDKVPAQRIESSVSCSEEGKRRQRFVARGDYDALPRITANPNPSLGSALQASRVRNVGSTIVLLLTGIINEPVWSFFYVWESWRNYLRHRACSPETSKLVAKTLRHISVSYSVPRSLHQSCR